AGAHRGGPRRHRRLPGTGARRSRVGNHLSAMSKNFRWKLLTILGVVALSVLAFYPPSEKVKLGLDLKGGVHLVLRVQTDDALRVETETTSERLREELSRQGLEVGSIVVDGITAFRVEGVPADRDQEFRRIADDWVGAVYERSGAGGTYTFTMRPAEANRLRKDSV